MLNSEQLQPAQVGSAVPSNDVAMSREFLSSRGTCCGNFCKNCPYYPRFTAGTKEKYYFP